MKTVAKKFSSLATGNFKDDLYEEIAHDISWSVRVKVGDVWIPIWQRVHPQIVIQIKQELYETN